MCPCIYGQRNYYKYIDKYIIVSTKCVQLHWDIWDDYSINSTAGIYKGPSKH